MKIDLERAVKAPFVLPESSSPLSTYLITGGIAFGIFIITQVLSFMMQLVGGVAQAMSSGDAFVVGAILVIALTIIITIGMILLYAAPVGFVTESIKLEVYSRESVMPSWTGNYGRFFMNGLKFMLLMLIYFLVVGILIAIPIAIAGVAAALTHGSDIAGIFLFFAIIISCLIYFIFMLIFPFIWVRFAAENSIKSGLNIVAIVGKIFENIGDYLLAIVFWIVLSIGMVVVCIVLCITCVGILALPLVQMFIYPIIYMNLFAQVYKD